MDRCGTIRLERRASAGGRSASRLRREVGSAGVNLPQPLSVVPPGTLEVAGRPAPYRKQKGTASAPLEYGPTTLVSADLFRRRRRKLTI